MRVVFLLLLLLPFPFSAHAEDLGELSANPAVSLVSLVFWFLWFSDQPTK